VLLLQRGLLVCCVSASQTALLCSTTPVGASSWINAVASSSLPSCYKQKRRTGVKPLQKHANTITASSEAVAVTIAAATHRCYNVQPAGFFIVIAKDALQQEWEAAFKEATRAVPADHSPAGSSSTPSRQRGAPCWLQCHALVADQAVFNYFTSTLDGARLIVFLS
jgi:hypothetical protein